MNNGLTVQSSHKSINNQKQRIKLSLPLVFLITSLVLIMIVTVGLLSPKKEEKTLLQKSNNKLILEKGTWYWKSPDELSNQEKENILNFAQSEGFSAIYLDLSKISDIVDGDPDLKNANSQKLMEAVSKFVLDAKKRNISVQALGGNTNWAHSSYWYIPLEFLNFTEEYNKAYPDLKLTGIQYDIEFYNDKNFETSSNKNAWKLEFLDLTNQIVNKVVDSKVFNDSFQVGFAIPFWYDSNRDFSKKMKWRGEEGSFLELFIDSLNKRENNYIALMAYRINAGGKGGVVEVSKEEFEIVEDRAENVSIIVALDTSAPKEEEYVSFYGKTEEELKETFEKVKDEYSTFRSLKGFAIHSLESYKELVNKSQN